MALRPSELPSKPKTGNGKKELTGSLGKSHTILVSELPGIYKCLEYCHNVTFTGKAPFRLRASIKSGIIIPVCKDEQKLVCDLQLPSGIKAKPAAVP